VFVGDYITEHQNQFPGRWQRWSTNSQSKKIAAELNAGFLAKEYAIGRIIEKFAR
jgi:hypothetical protein